MEGIVLFGVNNIYTVLCSGKQFLCRIKGKVLDDEIEYYNPIAVGDYVEIAENRFTPLEGWILSRGKRRNSLVRYNKKRNTPQVIASNVDLAVCITSVKSPPFRPRFLDRLILSAVSEGIEVLVCVNKCDLPMDGETEERLKRYSDIGYRVIYVSAETGSGIEELKLELSGKTSVFAGQSGVGKSTLLNRIDPTVKLRVGEISKKYDRGVHTTRFSVMLLGDSGMGLIDTPGIRELFLFGLDPDELRHFFPEFRGHSSRCSFTSCLHINEPGCEVKSAVSSGAIHGDRYESYIRIYESLVEQKEDR